MREIAELFNLLSDQTRLRILNLLFQRPLCVCELEEVLQMSQSRISHQLKLLRAANLVIDERDRQWIIYRIQPQTEHFSQLILDILRQWLEQNEIAKSDLARLQECMVCGSRRTTVCNGNRKIQNPNVK
ncbi:MAG: metalloregulator ArsR/SmtB family transcription factor [bacterium]|nr:metalloregulator ArsR/SmtB family transcription factor [bacterium]